MSLAFWQGLALGVALFLAVFEALGWPRLL